MIGQYPLIRTKIHTPRLRSSLLRRPRLANYVHANIEKKLILLSAGAGYGKTSVLVEYAHDTELPVCWYSLDRNDTNTYTFIEYLVASVRERFPRFGESLLTFIRERSTPAEDVEPLVRLLVHEIEEHTDRYFAVVLDDYHEVAETGEINAIVDGLLCYLPEHCHLIISSRAIPRRLTLTRLAARQEVVGLGVADLRFTADEIRGLLQILGYDDLSEAHLETITRRTEGWVTGLLLAAQASRQGTIHDILEITGATGGVFDYMAEQVLDQQPEDVRHFLLRSALFPEMTPPLVNALLEIDSSAQFLRDLADRNLFTVSMDAEGSWYQYHRIFREFLVTRFEREDPEAYRALCLKQARLMAHRGDWQSAIESYLLVEAHAQAAEAIEVVAQDSFDAGSWESLRRWIDALPDEVLGEQPRLLLFRAKIHSELGELSASARLLDRACQAYEARGDAVGAARTRVQSAVVQRFRGNPQEAIETGYRALAQASGRDPLTAAQAHREIGISLCTIGQYAQGMEALGQALAIAERNADDINAAIIALDMGTSEGARGNLTGARAHYHQALMYWRRTGRLSGLAVTLQNLGVVHHHLGQYAEAEQRLQEGLSSAEAVADARVQAYSLASLGDLYRDTRRYREALEQYANAQQAASTAQITSLTIYVLDALANTHRLLGDGPCARKHLTEALDLCSRQPLPYELGLCRLSSGILSIDQGEYVVAEEQLREAVSLLNRVDARRDLARAHLFLAIAAEVQGDRAAAIAEIERVTTLASDLGTFQFLVAEGSAVAPLLRCVEEENLQGIDTIRVRQQIERLDPAIEAQQARQAARAHQLQLLALNGGQVLRSGTLVTDWESATAKHMVFMFAAHRGGLTRERVIDLLWPDHTPERGNSLFHSTMYRLRAALGKEMIVHQQGLYRLNPEVACYYDADEFEMLARQGEGDDEVAHAARVQAISLFHTPFLESLDSEWCVSIREALHNQMLALLMREANHMAASGLFSEAEAYFARMGTLDPYDERAHRGIMWCRAHTNNLAGATRQYQECVRTLREELGVEPSHDTLALHQALRAGRPSSLPLS